jgi:predicted nucleotidyltransferase
VGVSASAVDVRAQDLEVLRALFERFPSVREVRVFGSRATGRARRASDIDLAIDAPEAAPAEWGALREALDEAPIIFELDVVRRDTLASPRLLEKIAREGVVIYASAA